MENSKREIELKCNYLDLESKNSIGSIKESSDPMTEDTRDP